MTFSYGSTPKSVGRGILERFSSIKSTTFNQHAQAVVLKVSIAVGSSLDEFHFSVEAFRDAVVLTKCHMRMMGVNHFLMVIPIFFISAGAW